jgi:hypothetical protein
MWLPPSCQHWRDMSAPQLLAQWLRIISPVSLHLPWASPWPAALAFHWRYRFHKGESLGNIVDIGSGQQSSKRNALSVSNHMMLTARLGPIGGVGPCEVPPKTALSEALSTTARLQSMRSALCNRSRSSRCNSSHTPACCQSRSLRQHVIPLPQPISWGRSSHGIPVLRTNRIPANTFRAGILGRPPFAFGGSGGNSGSMCSHSSSETKTFVMDSPPSFDARVPNW